jgi:cold shock CspA family protein
MTVTIVRRSAMIVRWGARGFGFARDNDGQEWFVHSHNIIGSTTKAQLPVGTLIEFEPHPHPKNDGREPEATMVRLLERP